MPNTDRLDNVIRQVREDTRRSGPGQVMVIIDAAKGAAVPRPGILAFAKDLRYFLVSNNLNSRSVARGRTTVTVREGLGYEHTININIDYLASCPQGNEERVAEALFRAPHPGAALNLLFTKWTEEYVRSRTGSFIGAYFTEKPILEAHLLSRATRDTGLSLQLKLSLEGENSLSMISFGPLVFFVRPSDFHEEIEIRLKGELEVEESLRINVILSRNSYLPDMIKSEARRYFSARVPLQRLRTDLNNGNLASEFKAQLSNSLARVGRRVRFISIERTGGAEQDAVDSFRRDVDIACQIQEYPLPITIKNSVLMTLHNITRYRASGSPDLERWVRENLNESLKEVLFDVKYIDLLLAFPGLVERVKGKIRPAADGIGYSIKQLITVPDLEPYKWLDNFIVRTEPQEEMFETSLAGCPVKLTVVVTTHVKDLQGIARYLNRRQDVPALMKDAVLRVTEQYMHTVAPERFYMRFSHVDKHQHPREKPVQSELTHIITDTLEKDFNADVIAVSLKVGETPLTLRWSELQKQFCDFEVTVSSRDPLTSEDVTLKGTFRVESLDYKGWDNFLNRAHSLEHIRRRLESIIHSLLDVQTTEVLAFRDPDSLSYLDSIIVPTVKKHVLDEFGLYISIDTFLREKTELEATLQQTNLVHLKHRIATEVSVDTARREAIAQQKRHLYTELSVLIAEGDVQQSNELLERIKLLDTHLPDNATLDDSTLKRLTQHTRQALPGQPANGNRQLVDAGAADDVDSRGHESDLLGNDGA